MNNIFLVFLSSIMNIFIAEDSEPISTSRPGVYNPTNAIASGQYQFEMGYNSDLNDNSSNSFLFRTGLISNSEIQIGYGENISIGALYGGISLVNKLEQSVMINATLSDDNSEIINTDIYLPFSLSTSFLPIAGHLSFSLPKEGDSSLGYALATSGNLNPKLGWFFEYYGNLSEKSHGIDLGSTFLITNIIQMDLSGGIMLNDTESKFIDIGLSVRLPN